MNERRMDSLKGNGQQMNWYVMRTVPGKERAAAELIERKIPHRLWDTCRILRKHQLFRIQGQYINDIREMFPGYLFIRTDSPDELAEELKKARQFPQLIGNQQIDIVPVEEKDLDFLQDICGKELEHDMGLSAVEVDGEGRVVRAKGALAPYMGRIKKQRLRHRIVVAEVELFNREEEVLFGVKLAGDEG